jgi:hypothetical protein
LRAAAVSLVRTAVAAFGPDRWNCPRSHKVSLNGTALRDELPTPDSRYSGQKSHFFESESKSGIGKEVSKRGFSFCDGK